MRAALIIIDMQKGFMNNNTEYLEEKISDFVDRNRTKFVEVIATQYINHKKTPCYVFEGWKGCIAGTEETKIVSKLSPKVNRIFEKDVYSCWHGELKSHIEILELDKVYLCGVNTGCCVLHSAFDIYNDLQDCTVIKDLCGSTSGESSHKAAIQVLEECITKQRVITSEQVEKELEQ